MTPSQRPNSVRARGARRLTQTTVGMVVVGVGGVAGLAIHDSQQAHASTSTSVTQTTSAESPTDGTSAATSGDMSSSSGSSTVTATQSAPQATSGGS